MERKSSCSDSSLCSLLGLMVLLKSPFLIGSLATCYVSAETKWGWGYQLDKVPALTSWASTDYFPWVLSSLLIVLFLTEHKERIYDSELEFLRESVGLLRVNEVSRWLEKKDRRLDYAWTSVSVYLSLCLCWLTELKTLLLVISLNWKSVVEGEVEVEGSKGQGCVAWRSDGFSPLLRGTKESMRSHYRSLSLYVSCESLIKLKRMAKTEEKAKERGRVLQVESSFEISED